MNPDLFINQLAQGAIDMRIGIDWFLKMPRPMKVDVLNRIAFYVLQSRPVAGDVKDAISLSGLKQSFTPCVVLNAAVSSNPIGSTGLKVGISRMINLPPEEQEKSFRLLISLLNVSGRRQRNQFYDAQKWWHQDLSDQTVVDKLKHQLE